MDPEFSSAQLCAFTGLISGRVQMGGLCSLADISEHTLGDAQVERIKKTSLLNETWQDFEDWFTPGY